MGVIGRPNKREERLYQSSVNYQGSTMKIVEYNNSSNIIVEFQDEYKARVHGQYKNFQNGKIKNPYAPFVFGVGMIGEKYSNKRNNKVDNTKEYTLWYSMMRRCFDENFKNKNPTYKNVTCCNEWRLFENFYEWLHSQSNFDKWFDGYGTGYKWALDKDILIKGNKIYSPETCCLVPSIVNHLLIKRDNHRGDYPICIEKKNNKYQARCNKFTIDEHGKVKAYREYLGVYETIEEAFNAYKKCKEDFIKQIAQIEFDAGNITIECYNAMMKYEVEITD